MIITIEIMKAKRDFKVNELQKVRDTLEILSQSGYLELSESVVVRSVRNDAIVDIDKNYTENEIYGGDVITVS